MPGDEDHRCGHDPDASRVAVRFHWFQRSASTLHCGRASVEPSPASSRAKGRPITDHPNSQRVSLVDANHHPADRRLRDAISYSEPQDVESGDVLLRVVSEGAGLRIEGQCALTW
jgi:hypothetical protein